MYVHPMYVHWVRIKTVSEDSELKTFCKFTFHKEGQIRPYGAELFKIITKIYGKRMLHKVHQKLLMDKQTECGMDEISMT